MSNPPNIYIVGAQCTGKTTLVNNVRKYFESNPAEQGPPPVTITEVARSVLRQHSFTAADVVTPARSLELQRLILNAQAAQEQKASNRWFIADRSGADPIAYALRYVGGEGTEALIKSTAWSELRDRMKEGVVVVCEAGKEAASWLSDDGVRLMPKDVEDWVLFHNLFCEFLGDQGIGYHILPATVGDHGTRVDFVVQHWRERLRN